MRSGGHHHTSAGCCALHVFLRQMSCLPKSLSCMQPVAGQKPEMEYFSVAYMKRYLKNTILRRLLMRFRFISEEPRDFQRGLLLISQLLLFNRHFVYRKERCEKCWEGSHPFVAASVTAAVASVLAARILCLHSQCSKGTAYPACGSLGVQPLCSQLRGAWDWILG